MKSRIIIFLLLLNLVTTLVVGYTVYTNVSEESTITVETSPEGKKFEENMYKGLSMLMSGQSQLFINQNDLNISILRVHHFVAPHVDKFYNECPECQKEKQRIFEEEKDNITFNMGADQWPF